MRKAFFCIFVTSAPVEPNFDKASRVLGLFAANEHTKTADAINEIIFCFLFINISTPLNFKHSIAQIYFFM